MSDRYLIDTSVWIHFYRRNPPERLLHRVRELVGNDLAATNEVIEMETLLGYGNEEQLRQKAENRRSLIRLPIRRRTWDIGFETGLKLRRAGVSAKVADLLIAATALEHRVAVVHCDTDFDHMARHLSDLSVESLLPAA